MDAQVIIEKIKRLDFLEKNINIHPVVIVSGACFTNNADNLI